MIICLVGFRQIIEEILFYTEYNSNNNNQIDFRNQSSWFNFKCMIQNSCLPSNLLLIDRCIIINVLPVTLVLYINDYNEIKIISL